MLHQHGVADVARRRELDAIISGSAAESAAQPLICVTLVASHCAKSHQLEMLLSGLCCAFPRVKFCRVDVGRSRIFPGAVFSTPTILLYQSGRFVARHGDADHLRLRMLLVCTHRHCDPRRSLGACRWAQLWICRVDDSTLMRYVPTRKMERVR